MRDLTSFKRLLGKEADAYTQAQLEELRKQMYEMADLLLDIYVSRCEAIDCKRLRGSIKAERSKNELTKEG